MLLLRKEDLALIVRATADVRRPISAQIRLQQAKNPEVSAMRRLRIHDREPSQVTGHQRGSGARQAG